MIYPDQKISWLSLGKICVLGLFGLILLSAVSQPPISRPVERYKSQPRVLFAQASPNQGDSLVVYFKSENGVDMGTLKTCPVGWTMALNGYGPHYVGVFGYDWLQGGWAGTGGGWLPLPPSSSTPSTPGTPTTGGGGPGSPGGGGGGESGGPGTPDGGGGDVVPDEPGGTGPAPLQPQNQPPENSQPQGRGFLFTPLQPEAVAFRPGREEDNQKFYTIPWLWGRVVTGFINQAFAQGAFSYILRTIAIGSDSVCSTTSLTVVPGWQIFQNIPSVIATTPISADACAPDPFTGSITCNRCVVCVK